MCIIIASKHEYVKQKQSKKRGCRKTKNVILNGHACPVKNLKVHTFPLDYT